MYFQGSLASALVTEGDRREARFGASMTRRVCHSLIEWSALLYSRSLSRKLTGRLGAHGPQRMTAPQGLDTLVAEFGSERFTASSINGWN